MPHRTFFLYLSLGLATLSGLLSFLANQHDLYFTFWWYDVMMHFLTGFTLGFFVYWLLFHSGLIFLGPFQKSWLTIFTVFVFVIVIGVVWEYFEYFYHITDSHEGYALDTFNDLVLDALGAVVASLISLRRHHG